MRSSYSTLVYSKSNLIKVNGNVMISSKKRTLVKSVFKNKDFIYELQKHHYFNSPINTLPFKVTFMPNSPVSPEWWKIVT